MNEKYQTLIFDLDDTLLNFKSAEKQALQALFSDLKVKADSAALQAFSVYNQSLWKKLEKKEITRSQLFEQRFQIFFKNYYQLEVSGLKCSQQYLSYLANGHEEIKGATQMLTQLKTENKQLFLATNGVAFVQEQRLKDSNLVSFFDQIFVSEKVGCEKPDPRFFTYLFEHSNALPQKTAMVGDSLSSDILGGSKAGIDTFWFNPKQTDNFTQVQPTYQISALDEILKYA